MNLNSINEITEYLLSEKKIMKLIVQGNKALPSHLINLLKKESIPLVRINEVAFRKKYPEARGVVGIVEAVKLIEPEEMLKSFSPSKHKRILLLDEISDPQNIGAMLRSCLCFNFDGVIMTSRNTAPLAEGVVGSSAGACFHLPVSRVNNLSKLIELLRKYDFWTIGTSPGKGEWIDTVDTCRNLAVTMGNEQKGIRPKVLNYCDYHIKIPMVENFNSLNVSVAFGIIAFSIYLKN